MTINRRRFVSGAAVGLAALAGCQGLRSSGQPSATDTTTGPETTATEVKTSIPSEFAVAWKIGPNMPNRRTQTTAVALDGRLYVIGGIVDDDERMIAVYNPSETT